MHPRLTPILVSATLLGAACAAEPVGWEPYDPIPWVDPIIATGGMGFGQGSSYPGAAAPFGMVAVSPDTRTDGAHVDGFHNGGYWYEDHLITGFSHIHLQGTGAPDYGNVLLFPADGWSEDWKADETRVASFSHEREAASPGYYAVEFDDGIHTEIAAGQRVAIHRFHFPEGSDPTLVIDMEHALSYREWSDEELHLRRSCSIDLYPDTGLIQGATQNAGSLAGRYGGFMVYLHAEVDPPPTSWGTWDDAGTVPESTGAGGYDLGGWLGFADQPGGTTVTVRVGISYTGTENARENLWAEAAGRDLEALKAKTEDEWRRWLGRIRVWGGTDRERTIFHSALYRALLMPNLRSDADGSYLGFDSLVHHEPGDPFYSDMSLWDTYRTLHPLVNLAFPQAARDFSHSLARMAEQSGGCLPRWPCGHGDSGSMVGDPADIVLADAWLKGIDGWDVDAGFDAARLCADAPRPDSALYGGRAGIEEYLGQGWVASDATSGSVARTLEYTWADHAMARWASALGREDDASRYWTRSRYFLNLWDEESGFFRGRATDGSFEPLEEFTSTGWWDEYVEGDAWQYLWLAPQDAWRLADLMGGPEAMLDRLDEFFWLSTEEEESIWPETYYWHGNEPDLHVPYLYALLDQPGRGAPWVRWVRETRYGTGAHGVDGNDDGGTLSAWYVLSALGLYPITGTETYALGPPLFRRAEVDMLDGVLVVEATGSEHVAMGSWVSASLDGAPIEGGTLQHSDLAQGATLRFVQAGVEGLVDSERGLMP